MIKPITEISHRPKETSLIIHSGGTWYDTVQLPNNDFFTQLTKSAMRNGFQTYLVHLDTHISKLLLHENHIHIKLSQGPSTQKCFHVMPSYIWGFWYLDPAGTHWNSSTANKAFNPKQINRENARNFFQTVAGVNKRRNRSKFKQSHRDESAQVECEVAIFLQDIEKYRNPVHFIKGTDIIETTAKSVKGLVKVKLHPAQSSDYQKAYLECCERYSNVVVTEQSIHDMIPSARRIITQNSAVGFEALMYKKPIITCAKSDYHHATIVARNSDQLSAAISCSVDQQNNFPFAKYFYWFLADEMLEPKNESFSDRVWERIEPHLSGF